MLRASAMETHAHSCTCTDTVHSVCVYVVVYIWIHAAASHTLSTCPVHWEKFIDRHCC